LAFKVILLPATTQAPEDSPIKKRRARRPPLKRRR
jgi:hypothetical protein